MRFPHDPPQNILILLPPERNFVVLAGAGGLFVLSVSRRTCSPCHPRRAQAPCHPDQAKRAEGSAALLYRPWHLLSLLRLPARLLRFCSRGTHRLAVPCYRCGGFAFPIPLLQKKCCIAAFRFIFSSKEEWKNAHAIEKRIRCLFHSSFLYPNAGICRPERSRRVCFPCHPDRA